MIRVRRAVPAMPRISAGSQRCASRSPNFARLHGAPAYSGENSPVTLMPKYANAIHIRISASMKFGVATPT